MLSMGLPKRHHVVVYLHAKLKSSLTSESLQTQLKPDPEEVDACAWIQRPLASAIVAASDERRSTVATASVGLPESFQFVLFTVVLLKDSLERTPL